jgi:hypothetical protein
MYYNFKKFFFLLILFYFRCAVVNFCVSSGVSVLAVFVSFLCAILASAFYKYTSNREQMSIDDTTCNLVDQNNDDLDKPTTMTLMTEPSVTSLLPVTIEDESNNNNNNNVIESLADIEICIEENSNGNSNENENEENDEEASNEILIDTIEGTEEEIQKQQIANIYRLLNDQHLINNWTTTDFLDQLKMYGLHTYDEDEQEPEPEPEPS